MIFPRSCLVFFVSRVKQWQQFSYRGETWSILDIVVFGGRIYAITSIGLVFSASKLVRFVASKNQLLIVDFSPAAFYLEANTIDLSKMNVKLFFLVTECLQG
ncbi:hypothetical protein Patl1_29616 [Pistacia atlantica]|uniref:Uncharacterized protein n=1 Tax=Pistacia atlantica TaxID=434234 RepID=A0ACC1AER3_9ROSI|nr:hypothetical protein Patl1_29616 [Pistacia atlantica]